MRIPYQSPGSPVSPLPTTHTKRLPDTLTNSAGDRVSPDGWLAAGPSSAGERVPHHAARGALSWLKEFIMRVWLPTATHYTRALSSPARMSTVTASWKEGNVRVACLIRIRKTNFSRARCLSASRTTREYVIRRRHLLSNNFSRPAPLLLTTPRGQRNGGIAFVPGRRRLPPPCSDSGRVPAKSKSREHDKGVEFSR
jgi:hypothetical protein